MEENKGFTPLDIIHTIICVFGLIGNVIVFIIIFLLKEYKKSTTHWYILQLAIADTLFLATIPFLISENVNKNWNFGVDMCKVVQGILFINYYASISFLMVMSVDRYVGICKFFSVKWQKLRKLKSSFIISAVVWVLSILLSVPVIYFSTIKGSTLECKCVIEFLTSEIQLQSCLDMARGSQILEAICRERHLPNFGRCSSKSIDPLTLLLNINNTFSFNNSAQPLITSMLIPRSLPTDEGSNVPPDCTSSGQPITWNIYVLFNFFVMFLLPILVMVVCYGLITRKLWRSSDKVRSHTTDVIRSVRDEYLERVTIMCVVLVVVFILCWILFHAVLLAKLNFILLKGEQCKQITQISRVLVTLNSALNPFLYTFLRSGCKRSLKSLGKTSNSHSPDKNTRTMRSLNQSSKTNNDERVSSQNL